MVGGKIPFVLTVLLLPGFVAGQGALPQDDAGSGRDAPDTPDPDFTFEMGRHHTGSLNGPAEDRADYYAFTPEAGQRYRLSAYDSSGGTCTTLLKPDGSSHHECVGGGAFVADQAGTWYVEFTSTRLGAQAYRFMLSDDHRDRDLLTPIRDNALAEDDLPSKTPAPPTGPAPDCSGTPSEERNATSGRGDPHVPDLIWMATKTGFRAVLAFSTDEPVIAEYRISIGDRVYIHKDTTPRLTHTTAFDLYPIGEVACLQVAYPGVESEPHALLLQNAMNHYDDEQGAYTINYVVAATRGVLAQQQIEGAMDEFADRLYDSTDGHVRVGQALLLILDEPWDENGFHGCMTGNALAFTCDRLADFVWTHDTAPSPGVVLAYTFKDAIADPDGYIWMVAPFNGIVPLTDIASVMMHEFGHYAFGMQDLYVAGNCWDPETKISIMGNEFGAREFDGPDVPCPNGEALGPRYIPSWTLLTERFPEIPDRNGVSFGPYGDGGVYQRMGFVGP